MYGIGEICSQSGANDSPNNNGAGPAGPARRDLLPQQPRRASPTITDGTSNTIAVGERSHNLSYVTWVARSIDGWLGKTSPIEGGTDQFNPSPEECWTQVLGPAGLEDGTADDQQPRGPRRGLLEPPPRRGQHALRRRLGPLPQVHDQPDPWRALATRNFGEVISADPY